jgi:DNA-binding MarR family transcriptional regulator
MYYCMKMHLPVNLDANAFNGYDSDMVDRDDRPSITAWARLMRTSQALLSAVEADLKASGVPSLAWYDVLLELDRAGESGLRPYELQDAVLLAQYNVSRLAERLLKAGYIERLPCPEDGRGHILRVTPDGRQLRRKMWLTYRAAIAERFGEKLDDDDLRQLTAVLGKLS